MSVAASRMAGRHLWRGDVLLWLDVETSGLDPASGVLLEIAIQPTAMDADLTLLDEPFVHTIYHGRELRLLDVDPEVLAMHARSGLWKDSRGSDDVSLVWQRLRARLNEWQLHECTSVALAGRSVHFDRRWLEAKAPRELVTALHLSHRHFDLTAIKAFAHLAGVAVDAPEDAHRALLDVQGDIALARKLIHATNTWTEL